MLCIPNIDEIVVQATVNIFWVLCLKLLQNIFLNEKELLKKCHQCVETIVKAKDQQAAEANKNASILLKELDLEKVRYTITSSFLNDILFTDSPWGMTACLTMIWINKGLWKGCFTACKTLLIVIQHYTHARTHIVTNTF